MRQKRFHVEWHRRLRHRRVNLVLRNQGVWPFARRALNIDDRKPTVGIAVIHELLTSRGGEDIYTLAGVRKALVEQGFNVEDIVLKKWSDMEGPKPDVATFEEYKDQDLEEVLTDLDAGIKALEGALKEDTEFRKHLQTASLEELTKEFAKRLRVKEVTEEIGGSSMTDGREVRIFGSCLSSRQEGCRGNPGQSYPA